MFLFTVITYPFEQQRKNNYSQFKEEQNPEQDSLDLRNANKYVNEFYAKLLNLCTQEPTSQLLGKSTDYEYTCSCETPSWYMLYSDYTTNESPVVCGNCSQSVPLYRLPKILGEDEYYTVLGCQKAYNACDRLFLKGNAERSSYQRLSKPSSDLSKMGREICTAFEDAVGKPFYYYLFRYYSSHKPGCPVCSQPWKLDDSDELFIDYRCDKCRLVADKILDK